MIKIIKLVSGVEVVGELTKEDEHGIVLKNPLQINYKYFVSVYPSINFSKYMLFANDVDIHFPYSAIINTVDPRASLEEYYAHAVAEVKSDMDIMIDRQLTQLSEGASYTKENLLAAMLEAMPKPDLVN